MSRIGKQPVVVPQGVKVSVAGRTVSIEGPKGKLQMDHRPEVTVSVEDSVLNIGRKNDAKPVRAYHGMTRALLQNMVIGVTKGYQKNLDIVGVGWQAKLDGRTLKMQLGYCHSVDMPIPEGLNVALPNPQRLEVTGIDKQAVGQFAAEIRASRKPEPYKGKGVRYDGERIVRKAGKSFVGGK